MRGECRVATMTRTFVYRNRTRRKMRAVVERQTKALNVAITVIGNPLKLSGDLCDSSSQDFLPGGQIRGKYMIRQHVVGNSEEEKVRNLDGSVHRRSSNRQEGLLRSSSFVFVSSKFENARRPLSASKMHRSLQKGNRTKQIRPRKQWG